MRLCSTLPPSVCVCVCVWTAMKGFSYTALCTRYHTVMMIGLLSCSVSLQKVRNSCQSPGDRGQPGVEGREGGKEEGKEERGERVLVGLPEVINLHQKSNNVKMSSQHLQLSEPVFGLFLTNAQHWAFLQM